MKCGRGVLRLSMGSSVQRTRPRALRSFFGNG